MLLLFPLNGRFGLPVREMRFATRTFHLAKWPVGSAYYPTGFE